MDILDQLTETVERGLLERKHDAPNHSALSAIFKTLYYASLKQEEGRNISCRVAYLDRQNPDPRPPHRAPFDRWSVTRLGVAIPFTIANLVKLSMAVDPWASTLAIDVAEDNNVEIWGLIDQGVHWSTYIVRENDEGPEQPGLFHSVIEGVGDVAVYRSNLLLARVRQSELATRQVDVFAKGPVRLKLQRYLDALKSTIRRELSEEVYPSGSFWDSELPEIWTAALCRLLIGIQRYRHGGAVLITPTRRVSGLKIKYELPYGRLAKALETYAEQRLLHWYHENQIEMKYAEPHEASMPVELYLDEVVTRNELEDSKAEITGCVRYLTGLSRVDGLMLFQAGLSLRGFGVEITTKDENFSLLLASDATANKTKPVDLNHFGTRHRSMMRFCAAYDDSVGFVVSQDGDIRAITKVGASVVMWDNIRVHFIKEPKSSRLHRTPNK